MLTTCGGSGMSPDDVIGSADVILTYDRPETEGELPPDTLVEFDGVQCNPSGNPRSSPFTCRGIGNGRRYQCEPGVVWRLATTRAPCDDAVWVTMSRDSSALLPQFAASGLSANGVALVRIESGSSGHTEAHFSVLAGGAIR